jgi:AcrR family transcriptional regulator
VPRIQAGSLREHHEQTWGRLLDALELLLAERGYDEITLSDVARRAGIARNTVYNYAPDKNTLLSRVAERAGRSVADRVAEIAAQDAPAAARLGSIVAELVVSFAHGAVRFALFHELPGYPGPPEQQQWSPPYAAIVADVRAIIRAGVATREFRPIDDLDLIVTLLTGLVRAAVDHAAVLEPPERITVADTVTDLLLRSLRQD